MRGSRGIDSGFAHSGTDHTTRPSAAAFAHSPRVPRAACIFAAGGPASRLAAWGSWRAGRLPGTRRTRFGALPFLAARFPSLCFDSLALSLSTGGAE
jgi:hypothetical protein